MTKGLLIDYSFCTGCQACMMACQVEHDLPKGHQGIVINRIGVWPIDEAANTWQYDFVPIPTDECDLCEARVRNGEIPTCVKHCLAAVMTFGEVEDLAVQIEGKRKQLLVVPQGGQEL